jgi:N-acetylglutamate synthase
MISTSIRPFTVQDYPAVRYLWGSSEGIGLSSADTEANVRKFLERNPGLSFVVENSGEIVGAILVGHDGRRGLIHHLAVAPGFRRRGLGRALVQRGLGALRDAGIDKAHLLVFTDNAEGRAFWERIGATERVELKLFSVGTAFQS